MKCKCKSLPDYHRKDCPIYDIFGNKKINIINYQIMNTYQRISYLKEIYNNIIIAKIGDFYEILFDQQNIKLKNKLESTLDLKSFLKNKKEENTPLMIGFHTKKIIII